MIQYIKYILFGVALFLALRLLYRISRRLIRRKQTKEWFFKSYPIFEFSVWVAFVFWTINQLFSDKFYFNTLILGTVIVAIIFISYYVIRDFVAGLLLKTEYNITTDANISIEGTEGNVIALSYLSMEIENSEQEKIKIPYSKISGKKIKILNPSELLKKFNFDIEIKKTTDIIKAKAELKNKVLTSSWTSIHKEPNIKLKNNEKNTWIFTVYFFAQNETHAERVKMDISN